MATKEAAARGEADVKAELLAREDYVNRVNRAYREVLDDNIRLAEDLLHGCPPDRRGWEWHYVKRLAHLGPPDPGGRLWSVEAIAFSPDGTVARDRGGLTPGYDDTGLQATSIRVWDLATGQMRRSLIGIPKGIVAALAVSPDGTRIATVWAIGVHRLGCEVRRGALEQDRTGRPASRSAMSLGFTPDGRTLVAGYGRYAGPDPGYVKVWDVVTGHESFRLPGPAGGSTSWRSIPMARARTGGIGSGRTLGPRLAHQAKRTPRAYAMGLLRRNQPRRQAARFRRLGPNDPLWDLKAR